MRICISGAGIGGLVLAASLGGRVVTADARLHRGVRGGPLDHLAAWVTDPL